LLFHAPLLHPNVIREKKVRRRIESDNLNGFKLNIQALCPEVPSGVIFLP
jgi:hypothetical protein